MSGQCIAVVSGKGGTGKTSLTAGVGTALAQSGKRVLCVDCDIGLRNLDLALGLTDRALMDFSDVALDRCPLEAAVVAHPSIPNLYLLTAPVRMREPAVTEEAFRRMLQKIRQQFDFCLLDAPAGLGLGFRLAVCGADRCVVVTTQDASSLRDAQRAVAELRHVATVQLVVNRVQTKLLKRLRTTIDDAMDTAGLPLLGVVPEDQNVTLSANFGTPIVLMTHKKAAIAYLNIARRILGQRVPIMRIR